MSNSKTKTLIVAAVIVVLALSYASTVGLTAFAKSDKQSTLNKLVSDEQKERLKRLGPLYGLKHLVSISSGANYADFLSVRMDNSTQAFALKVRNEGVPSIYIGMLNVTKNGGNRTADWVVGLLRAQYLVEYIDKNGDGIYLPKDNDTRLQLVNFAKLDWSLKTSKETVNGVQGWVINMTATDRGAKYTIKTQVFNTGVQLKDGTPVAPTEAKIDFIFQNFPWSAEDSRLALVTAFGGQTGTGTVSHYDNSTEVMVERNAYAYFTWSSVATVDGVDSPVTVYESGNGAIHAVELNYVQGNNITHDPIVGAAQGSVQNVPTYNVPNTVSPTSPTFPGIYLIATVALVVMGLGVIMVAARKKLVEPKLKILS